MTSLSFREQNGQSRRLPRVGRIAVIWLAATIGTAPGTAQTVMRLESEASFLASDNPFLLEGEDNAAAAVELAARPEIHVPLSSVTNLDLTGEAAYRRYSNAYGDFLTGWADAAVTHRPSDFFSWDNSLSFGRELPIDALADSSDYSADTRAVRERFQGRSTISWTPDSYTVVTGSGAWEKLRYPDSDLLSSTRALQFEAGVSRRINPHTSLGLLARTTRTDLTGTGNLSADGVFATVSHRFAPDLEAEGQLGIEWTNYDLPQSGRARLSGGGNVCYRPEFTSLCVRASLQSEVSGLGGLQRELYAGVTAERRISEREDVSATAEYRRAEIGALDLETSTLRLNATYEHRLGPRLSVVTSADYLSRKYLNEVQTDAVVVQIGLTFGLER